MITQIITALVNRPTWASCCRAMTHVWSEAAPNILEGCQAPPPDRGDADAAYNAEKKPKKLKLFFFFFCLKTNSMCDQKDAGNSTCGSALR